MNRLAMFLHAGATAAAVVLIAAMIAATPARAGDAGSGCCGGLLLNGYLSTSFQHNWNDPESRTSQLRVFDTEEGDLGVDVVEIVLQKPVAEAGSSGFRIDLCAGSAIPAVAASGGLFRDEDGASEDIDLQQALVSYVAPIGSGLRLDFGKHITHLGYEVIEGYDGQNDHATRSFLFGYAIPFTHTGLRAGYTVSTAVSAAAYVVNGWDVVRDNNGAKTFGAQVILAPADGVTATLNWIGGPEKAGDDDDRRQVADAVLLVRPSDRLLLGLNGDYGTEENSAGVEGDEDAVWSGVALYARAGLTKKLAIAGRFEWFDDEDGVRTGTSQKLTGATITPEARLSDALVVRADFRFDASNEQVFEKEGRLEAADSQATLSLNATYSF